mgnify:FL=1
MVIQKEISLPSFTRGFHLITGHILDEFPELPDKGLMNIFIKHTSAGLTINENADPSVRDDLETIFNRMVPENNPDYIHTTEGPDDMPAHGKSSITGSSLTIPITGGKLNLGTWQGVYLCEFRNRGGGRKIIVTVYS